jgi:hypothetical protein
MADEITHPNEEAIPRISTPPRERYNACDSLRRHTSPKHALINGVMVGPHSVNRKDEKGKSE